MGEAANTEVAFYSEAECWGYLRQHSTILHEQVVSAYIVDGKRVCLIDHKDLGKWLPPGGHIRDGESAIEAVVREAREETGCEVTVVGGDRFYAEGDGIYQVPRPRFVQHEVIAEAGGTLHMHVNMVYFCRAARTGGDILTDEGSIKWFEMHELDSVGRLYPHTRMNAYGAIRELGDVIPQALVLENDRVLVPVGGRCPFGCSYCYTKRPDVYFGEPDPKGMVRKLAEIVRAAHGGSTLTAQLGYDNDPFVDPEIGMEFVYRMLWMPIHIGFSTKAWISGEYAKRLAAFRRLKREEGFNLSALVTLTCSRPETVALLEPNAPDVRQRLETVTNLSSRGIPVLINLRPVLPSVVAEEELIETIHAAKKAGAIGIVFGAFWTDPEGIVTRGLPYAEKMKLVNTRSVQWSPHGMNWLRYEDSGLLERLGRLCSDIGVRSFESSAEAVRFISGLS